MPLAIKDLIENNVKERDLHSFLKENMSILGSTYAMPQNEFIIIPEFVVGEDRCDFVLLTSRSRMNIYFIELKGADFNFLTKDDSVAEQINKASKQIEERLSYVNRNYESFRRHIHEVRQQIECGTYNKSYLQSQQSKLQVDPNKEVNVYGIIIGGRTNNDIIESRTKWNKERQQPNIRYESWDSWLRKTLTNKC